MRLSLLLPPLLTLAAATGSARELPEAAAAARDAEAGRLWGLARAGEPSVGEVQRAAAGRAAPSPEAAASWRTRSRLAALLPRLSTSYRHDDRSVHVTGLTGTSEVDYLRSTPGDTVSVNLDWSLDGLVLGRAELQAVAASAAAEVRRRAAVDRATRLYYERLRLRLAVAANAPGTPRARAEQELELGQVTAELDALTGLYPEEGR